MKTYNRYTAAVLAALMLAACSSSGSNSSPSADIPSSPQTPPADNSAPTDNSTPAPDTTPPNQDAALPEGVEPSISGDAFFHEHPRMYEMPPAFDPLGQGHGTIGNTNDIYTLVVNGQKIAMLPPDAVRGGKVDSTDLNMVNPPIKPFPLI